MGETILLAKSARSFGEGNMKAGVTLSKIVSTSIALILCSAVLVFALTALGWGAALPASGGIFTVTTSSSSSSPSISSSPGSGAPSSAVNVTGHNIPPLSGTGSVSVTFGYSTSTNCNPFNSVGSATSEMVTNGTFTGTFNWPSSGTTVGTTYTVCAQVGGVSGTLIGGSFQPSSSSSSSSSASVSVDTSSYKVGDTMTVTGTGFPASTSVTVKLQSSNGKTTTTLGNVTTGTTGAFTQDYTVPAHPTNSVVVIVSYGSGQQATSGSFTVKAKSSSSTSTHAPTPAPTSPPPTTYYPPAGLAATPTPVPTATDTPTAVPTDTPTPVPTPTVAPVPTPVPVVANHNTSPFANLLGGKLPVVLAIGLETLVGLSILFVLGRLLLI